MNSTATNHNFSWLGAVIGATLFVGLGVVVRFWLEHPPAFIWLVATFGLAGALVGYLGMRNSYGVIGATLGMIVCMLGGAALGDEVGGFIPVEEAGIPMEGKILRIDGPTLDGKSFDVSAWRGKVVLVDFWATWCGPCLAELPNVKKAYDRYHKDGFEVVGVSLDGDSDRLADFVKRHDIPWPQIFFTEAGQREWSNPLVQRYDITGIPTLYLLDRKGCVAPVEPRGDALAPAVEKLLAGDVSDVSPDDRGVHVGLFRMGLLVGACVGGFFGILTGDFIERLIRRKRVPVGLS